MEFPKDIFLDYVNAFEDKTKENFKKSIIKHVKDIKDKYIKSVRKNIQIINYLSGIMRDSYYLFFL